MRLFPYNRSREKNPSPILKLYAGYTCRGHDNELISLQLDWMEVLQSNWIGLDCAVPFSSPSLPFPGTGMIPWYYNKSDQCHCHKSIGRHPTHLRYLLLPFHGVINSTCPKSNHDQLDTPNHSYNDTPIPLSNNQFPTLLPVYTSTCSIASVCIIPPSCSKVGGWVDG